MIISCPVEGRTEKQVSGNSFRRIAAPPHRACSCCRLRCQPSSSLMMTSSICFGGVAGGKVFLQPVIADRDLALQRLFLPHDEVDDVILQLAFATELLEPLSLSQRRGYLIALHDQQEVGLFFSDRWERKSAAGTNLSVPASTASNSGGISLFRRTYRWIEVTLSVACSARNFTDVFSFLTSLQVGES